ncbi:hypothetical protein B0H14DRAFT_3165637 [Mycena olivaceomarginata]|nr:hypothetical protein B0H14DRAFT_3165637 [Mycena olivaceomarginata]
MSDERKHRNRISAQASRDRRKAQLLHLERQVTELEETNGRLRAGLAEATLQLDYLTKSSAAEGRSTGLTPLAPQPNIFILQTSEAPGSGQKIIHEDHNSSHRSGDASVYYIERSTLPACPDIMSTVKKPASFAKAPKKSAKSKTTSSHPPGCAVSNAEVDRSRPLVAACWSPIIAYKLSIGAAQNTQLSKALTAGSEKNIFVLPKGPSGRVKLAPKTKSADASAKGSMKDQANEG